MVGYKPGPSLCRGARLLSCGFQAVQCKVVLYLSLQVLAKADMRIAAIYDEALVSDPQVSHLGCGTAWYCPALVTGHVLPFAPCCRSRHLLHGSGLSNPLPAAF